MSEPCNKEAEIATIRTDVKAIFKRIDEQLKLSESVNKLATSVEIMAYELKGTKETVAELKADVEEIKSKPGKRWDLIITIALTGIVSAIITYFVSRMGLK